MRNVKFAAAAGTNVSFQSVVAASLALAQKPNHYFSLLISTVAIARSPISGRSGFLSAICVFLPYSRTACTSPLRSAFPPVDSASTALQTLQVTVLAAWLKISCSLPHLGHLTRRKVLFGLGMSLFQSDIFYTPIVWLVFLGGCRLCGA